MCLAGLVPSYETNPWIICRTSDLGSRPKEGKNERKRNNDYFLYTRRLSPVFLRLVIRRFLLVPFINICTPRLCIVDALSSMFVSVRENFRFHDCSRRLYIYIIFPSFFFSSIFHRPTTVKWKNRCYVIPGAGNCGTNGTTCG